MLTLFIVSFVGFTVYASDYCAFNRAATPEKENNAATYAFINGEFNRDYSFSSGGQVEIWNGMPYYKMTLTNCYLPELFLFRHIDNSKDPSVNTWVISANVGTLPSYGYAYCGAATGVTSDPSTPDGDCDGNWFVGQPNDPGNGQIAAHSLDEYFKVMVGGCPQVTCSSMEFVTNAGDAWEGTFSYLSPNIYKQIGNSFSENTADGGTFYLMWNYKVWRWAVNEYNNEYDVCEQYKASKGFTSVANVNIGPQSQAIPVAGGISYFRTPGSTSSRYIKCIGTTPTPEPTPRHATVPTPAPQVASFCHVQWSTFPSKVLKLCGGTPSPVSTPQLSDDPTSSPTTPAPTVTGATNKPTPSPVTPYPTTTGTARPTSPTTKAPTNDQGQAAPTQPTTSPPTSQGVPGALTPSPGSSGSTPSPNSGGDGDGDGDSNANTINCSMYLLCIFIAIYQLLF